ncbi:MAG: hypothetical protein ACLFP8_02240 [Alphaproteobacteria bacterium]
MSSLIHLKQQFARAAADVARDKRFQQRPVLKIEDRTFRQILEPVERVFANGRILSHRSTLDVPGTIKELRTMCLEAQTAHTTADGSTRQRRTMLLNVLQAVHESALDGVDALGMRAADMDFFSLPDLTDVIREAAITHAQFLHNSDIGEALMKVADNIEKANKRLWHPDPAGMQPDYQFAADDYVCASADVA